MCLEQVVRETTISYPGGVVDAELELHVDDLQLGETIDNGSFGVVRKAKYIGKKTTIPSIVAFKMANGESRQMILSEKYPNETRDELIRMSEIMKKVAKHEHVAELYGICEHPDAFAIIIDFSPHGSLRKLLRRSYTNKAAKKSIDNKMLVAFARQIANGMAHLSNDPFNSIIHGYLSTENVIVCHNLCLKIVDYGIIRDTIYAERRRISEDKAQSWRWMAPEWFSNKRYTTESDVWSFGILLWEIMTFGRRPYPGIDSIGQLLKRFKDNNCPMFPPPSCPTKIHEIMKRCWNNEPAKRPSFGKLLDDLRQSMTQGN